MKLRILTAAAFAGVLLTPVSAHAGTVDLYASEQYSDEFGYTITWTTADDALTLNATGMPEGITFVDNGDKTGHFSGVVDVPADVYYIDATATNASSTTYHKTLQLTITPERAKIKLAGANPDSVKRTKAFVLKARVRDQDDGSFGDITLAGPGTFVLDRNGHVTTCDAKVVAGSLHEVKGPDYYDVTCKVPAGLRRGTYTVTHEVDGNYYAGTSKPATLRITR